MKKPIMEHFYNGWGLAISFILGAGFVLFILLSVVLMFNKAGCTA